MAIECRSAYPYYSPGANRKISPQASVYLLSITRTVSRMVHKLTEYSKLPMDTNTAKGIIKDHGGGVAKTVYAQRYTVPCETISKMGRHRIWDLEDIS